MECDVHTFGYLLVLKSVHCNMCALWDLSDTVSQYFYRHRSRRKKSHVRIYWSHHSMAPPSQLTVHKQSSTSAFSLSIALQWNHSIFANSNGTHWIYSVLIRLFLPHACNSVHSQGKQLCLLDVDFDFFTLHEFDIIMSFFRKWMWFLFYFNILYIYMFFSGD